LAIGHRRKWRILFSSISFSAHSRVIDRECKKLVPRFRDLNVWKRSPEYPPGDSARTHAFAVPRCSPVSVPSFGAPDPFVDAAQETNIVVARWWSGEAYFNDDCQAPERQQLGLHRYISVKEMI
jgi:hypothetical protein